MSIIDEDYLNDIYRKDRDFIDLKNINALFRTKLAYYYDYNGEIVDLIGVLKGRDDFHDRYIVRFNDGKIRDDVMDVELQFDYINEIAKIVKEEHHLNHTTKLKNDKER